MLASASGRPLHSAARRPRRRRRRCWPCQTAMPFPPAPATTPIIRITPTIRIVRTTPRAGAAVITRTAPTPPILRTTRAPERRGAVLESRVMTELTIRFERPATSLDAVQRAAYALSRTGSRPRSAKPARRSRPPSTQPPRRQTPEALIADFRNEVLDQVLRERIRAETEDVRKLVLALAFSKTGLTDARCLDSATPSPFKPHSAAWEYLPFRFERTNGRVLVTNMVGEHLFLSTEDFGQLAERILPADSALVRRLRAKHLIREAGDELPVELLAMKARTRYRRLAEFTALHIFVASLRCEHSCPYCQVSRQSADKAAFDMSPETRRSRARVGLPLALAEHQDRVPGRRAAAQLRADRRGRRRAPSARSTKLTARTSASSSRPTSRCSTITTSISAAPTTSTSRPRSTGPPISTTRTDRGPAATAGSWQPPASSESARTLGVDRVSALMTTTRSSLDRVREIIDTYVEQGLTRDLPAPALALRLRDQDQELRRLRRRSLAALLRARDSTTSSSSTARACRWSSSTRRSSSRRCSPTTIPATSI